MTSKAQRMASEKYRQEKLDRVTITVPKGKREAYKQLAAEMGISMVKLFQYGVEGLAQNYEEKIIIHSQGDKLNAEQRQLIDTVDKLTPKARKQLIKFLETLAG